MENENNIEKLYQELLETIKLLKQTGTLDKFFENISDMDFDEIYKSEQPFIDEDYTYRQMQDFCGIQAMKYAHSATKDMQKAKFYANYVDNLYKNYKSREKDIKNPDILKFIKDYEWGLV